MPIVYAVGAIAALFGGAWFLQNATKAIFALVVALGAWVYFGGSLS
tara:strand:+ start:11152 stop:11289 length:138 start_codon:yes stop_codon:yes gene_type:complete